MTPALTVKVYTWAWRDIGSRDYTRQSLEFVLGMKFNINGNT